MRPAHSRSPWLLVVGALALGACDQPVTSPEIDVPVTTSYAKADAAAGRPQLASGLAQRIDVINARLASEGSSIRLDYPWMFTTGPGTDPYARLRTGARWTTLEPTYVLDESDYPVLWQGTDVDGALVAAYDSWNAIPNSALEAHRGPDVVDNPDLLDAMVYDEDGICVDIEDEDWVFAGADIVVGGWLPEAYFSDCLGSSDIIAVTWTFIYVDGEGNPTDFNHDGYADRAYVEQYFNASLPWVTTGSQYLYYAYGFDVQSIAVHEDGHAHGLGHFGGPVKNQPFKLQPNYKVFNPEAVMNPYYLGGEKRDPFSTDIAGMRTMYAGH